MTSNDLLQRAISAAKAGRKAKARILLAEAIQQDERSEAAWLWLSDVVEQDEQRRTCLERVLAINPNNETARRRLEQLPSDDAATPPSGKARRVGGMTRKQRIIVGVMAGGVLLVLVILAGLWWEMNNRFAQRQSPLSPLALAITQLPGPPSPISTPQSSPLPLPTVPEPTPPTSPLPLPDEEKVASQYAEEVRPLAEKLQTTQPLSPGLELPRAADWRIVLVPLDERPHYVQTLLFPDWVLGSDEAPVTLYITYTYERGRNLGWVSRQDGEGSEAVAPVTQEISVTLRLIAEVEGQYYLIEELDGGGGEGARDFPGMVRRAVRPAVVLEDHRTEVEETLETIVGYLAGMDWDTSRDLPTRLAALERALDSPHWADRAQAASTLLPLLDQVGSQEAAATPVLIRLAEAEDAQVRGAAERALVRLGPDIVPVLAQTLEKEEDPAVRLGVIAKLERFGPQAVEAVPALSKALRDEDAEVRLAAAEALAGMGPDAVGAIPALAKALEDEDADVRVAAAWALREIGPQAGPAIPALAEALEDPEWTVREAAAGALGRIGPGAIEAVPALIGTLEDERLPVRVTGYEALRAITGQDFGRDPAAWQAWWKRRQ